MIVFSSSFNQHAFISRIFWESFLDNYFYECIYLFIYLGIFLECICTHISYIFFRNVCSTISFSEVQKNEWNCKQLVLILWSAVLRHLQERTRNSLTAYEVVRIYRFCGLQKISYYVLYIILLTISRRSFSDSSEKLEVNC